MGEVMPSKPKAYIMMATYNGEKYLAEQIDSILAQQGVDVTLRICDDCSQDITFEIDKKYQQNDMRVSASQNPHGFGVGLNFMQMVYEVNADEYDIFAFSDQDDVWLSDKLAVAAKVIKQTEENPESKAIDSIGVPVLYCSDLQDVDNNLENPVRELANLKLDLAKRATPLLRNYYSGCTMVMNGAMIRLLKLYRSKEFPRIHDAWCVMVAYYCGNFIVDMEHAQILRRITERNTIGAITPGVDIKNASITHLGSKSQRNQSRTALKLLNTYSAYINPEDTAMIHSFVSYESSFIKRLLWALSVRYSYPTTMERALAGLKFLLGRY